MFTGELNSLEVRVGSPERELKSQDSFCAYDEQKYDIGDSNTITCGRIMVGQYVSLQMLTETAAYLQILEMEVHGF